MAVSVWHLISWNSAGWSIGKCRRNILRADGINNLDLGIFKNTRIGENQRLQFRAEFNNATNTRDFGIPEGRANSANFLNQWGTNGGNRRIVLGIRYIFEFERGEMNVRGGRFVAAPSS